MGRLSIPGPQSSARPLLFPRDQGPLLVVHFVSVIAYWGPVLVSFLTRVIVYCELSWGPGCSKLFYWGLVSVTMASWGKIWVQVYVYIHIYKGPLEGLCFWIPAFGGAYQELLVLENPRCNEPHRFGCLRRCMKHAVAPLSEHVANASPAVRLHSTHIIPGMRRIQPCLWSGGPHLAPQIAQTCPNLGCRRPCRCKRSYFTFARSAPSDPQKICGSNWESPLFLGYLQDLGIWKA